MDFKRINKLYDELLSGISVEELPSKSLISFGRNILKAYRFVSALESEDVTPKWKARLVLFSQAMDEFVSDAESRLNFVGEDGECGLKQSEVISLMGLLQDILVAKYQLDNNIESADQLMAALGDRVKKLSNK